MYAVKIFLALVLAGLASLGMVGCESAYETQTVIFDEESGSVHVIGRQGREVSKSDVCINGDYVPVPYDAALRSAKCYNQGQENAFSLMFEYSGGEVYTGFSLTDNQDEAIRQAQDNWIHPYSVYIENGKAYVVKYRESFNNNGDTLEIWVPYFEAPVRREILNVPITPTPIPVPTPTFSMPVVVAINGKQTKLHTTQTYRERVNEAFRIMEYGVQEDRRVAWYDYADIVCPYWWEIESLDMVRKPPPVEFEEFHDGLLTALRSFALHYDEIIISGNASFGWDVTKGVNSLGPDEIDILHKEGCEW